MTELADSVPSDHSTVTVLSYGARGAEAGADKGAEVVLYRVNGGGHAVPGGSQIPEELRGLLGWRNQDVDGPAEVWKFFSRHTRGASAPRRLFAPFAARQTDG